MNNLKFVYKWRDDQAMHGLIDWTSWLVLLNRFRSALSLPQGQSVRKIPILFNILRS